MFHKKPFARILLSLSLATAIASLPSLANAGVQVATTITLSAVPVPPNINSGETVSFIVGLTCRETNWSSTVDVIDNSNGNAFASSQVVTGTMNSTETANFVVTFSSPGTYQVGVDATASGTCDFADPNIQPPAITVTVTAAATTTTTAAPTTTTTVAPTTTMVQTLPKTGTDTNNAYIALATAFAGAAIVLGRRRLVTK